MKTIWDKTYDSSSRNTQEGNNQIGSLVGPPRAMVGPRGKTLARACPTYIITYFFKFPPLGPGLGNFAPLSPLSSGLFISFCNLFLKNSCLAIIAVKQNFAQISFYFISAKIDIFITYIKLLIKHTNANNINIIVELKKWLLYEISFVLGLV